MKIIIREKYRLEITPSLWPISSPQHVDYTKALSRLEESIKRHIDDVESVQETWDTKEICEFCEESWEVWEKDDEDGLKKGMPVCCEKAQEEFIANAGKVDDKVS